MTNFPTQSFDEPPPGRMRRLMEFIRANLLAGLLVLGPLVATIFILTWMYFKVDPPVQEYVLKIVGIDVNDDVDVDNKKISDSGAHNIDIVPVNLSWLPDRLNPNVVNTANGQVQWLFGLGLLVIFIIVLLVGFLTRTFLGRWLFSTMEWIINRIPIVKTIYSSFRQLTDTFLAQKPEQKAQKEVVLVEYPEPGSCAVGFVTGTAKGLVGAGALKLFNAAGQVAQNSPPALHNGGGHPDELLLVFIPMSPLPTGGFLVVVPRSKVVKIEITVEQAFQLIVSGGLVQPPEPAITDAMLPENARPKSRRGSAPLPVQAPAQVPTPSGPPAPPATGGETK